MRSLLFISIFYLWLIACNDSIECQILRKTHAIDSLEYTIMNHTQTYVIREGRTASYKIDRFNTRDDGYAVISIEPELIIHRNFLKDTIDMSFVKIFKLIDCQYFIRKDSFIRVNFRINKKQYVMYKNPLKDMSYLSYDTSMAVRLDAKWRYIALHGKGAF